MNPVLRTLIQNLEKRPIDAERKQHLLSMAQRISAELTTNQEVSLNFICTHNSRRSHLSQVWAQCAADFLGVDGVQCFSAGTEATAVYPQVIETLKQQGFAVEIMTNTDNPIYVIKHEENGVPTVAFSKAIGDSFNPTDHFMAIMTCTQADVECPIVPGATARFSLPFEDPKIFDDSPQKVQAYRMRSEQIGSEMLFLFSQIKSLL